MNHDDVDEMYVPENVYFSSSPRFPYVCTIWNMKIEFEIIIEKNSCFSFRIRIYHLWIALLPTPNNHPHVEHHVIHFFVRFT